MAKLTEMLTLPEHSADAASSHQTLNAECGGFCIVNPSRGVPTRESVTSDRGGESEGMAVSRWSVARTKSPLDWLLAISAAVLIVGAAALNPLDQSDAQPAGTANQGLNIEVAVKLFLGAAIAGTAAVGLIARPHTRLALLRMPGILLVTVGALFVASSAFAFEPTANVSRAAAIILCTYIGFMAVAVTYLGVPTVTRCLFIGLGLHLTAAWILYLTGGNEVVFEENLGTATLVERMGSTAHPNSLGRIGALSCMLAIAVVREKGTRTSWPWIGAVTIIVMMGLATLFESMSRTALAAGIAGACAMLVDRLANRRGIAILLGLAATMLVGYLAIELSGSGGAVGSGVVSAGTKSGDVSELTSATGRDVIWGEAISLIAERPLTGWGMVAAPVLLEDFSFHTHNLLLHVFFSAGMFTAMVTLAMLLWTFVGAIVSGHVLLRGIAAYLLVSGMFEDSVFEAFPFASTLMWMTVLLMPAELWSSRKHPSSVPSFSAAT